ncbi:MAG: glycosyltransferase family 4 protein [Dokdonella sp.]|nr:glycosyltransferase family 4 protein [Dokdonella sp.]
MERFNQHVVTQLSRQYDISVCGPAGCDAFLPDNAVVASVRLGSVPGFLIRALWTSLRLVRRQRPDVVIAGSGLMAPVAWIVARWTGVRALVFLYGLDLAVPNFWYQRFWLPAIRACDGYLPISRFTHALAIDKGLAADVMEIVHPGVDSRTDNDSAPGNFRENYRLGDRPILLSVGRLTRRKGLVEFVRHCLPLIVAKQPDIVLVVAGGEPRDALHASAGNVSEDVRKLAAELGMEGNILLLGKVSDDVVWAAFRASQVHVFPVQQVRGDIEGFGIVALEAASAGVPTVAFAVGGVPDAVGEGVSGLLIEPGNYREMAVAVLRTLAIHDPDGHLRAGCIRFARQFSWDNIGVRLNLAVSRLAGWTQESGGECSS